MRRGRTVLAAVAALVAGCGSPVPAVPSAPAAAQVAGVVVDHPDVPGGTAAVRARDSGATGRPLLLWVHGSGTDEDDPVEGSGSAFTAALLDRGWVVASAVADGNAWGSPASQDDYRTLARAAAARWPVGPVVVLSVSMGGVAGLDLASDGTVPGVVGWYGVSAVTDLGAARARFGRSIDRVLDAGQVAAVDPSRVPVSRFAGLGMVLATATDDDRVPTAEQALPFAARVPQVQVRTCTGGHVSADCFDVDALLGLLPG